MNREIQGPGVHLSEVNLHFPNASSPLFEQLSLTLSPGQWHCILGQSGCGKTTLLRLLANLLPEDVQYRGQVTTFDGNPVSPQIAYMAQQDLLLPWLNVMDNVCFSYRLRYRKVNPQTQTRAMHLLAQVGLADYAQASPSQLSGGMRQRVALVRTLMQEKPIVIMDEPFSALDAVTRYKLQELAAELLQNRTVLLITHDPQEALRLGHHLFLMQGKPARLTAFGAPEGEIPRPINAVMADAQHQLMTKLAVMGNEDD
ncbi:ABC transporter ATP-binding protein [Photobacterium sp. 1_MG-2023]|uniref:ABC transporter ATP-binding protein n=1 Tax=Photobacterium sp. 1_MG-2023 TaxID=3062646 RepID=UPI0026E2DC15|nr:ATP-binding cassette domain-containing protein [Photobacterium sp. 1_MG-2023]MDO6706724.1 ATP-binding cassette domain-containing protein [Photobacterium sp. 1_MG-2023]